MFTSEPELFSIGIISLPLDVVSVFVINIIQIEKTTCIANFAIEPILTHKGSIEIIDNEPEVALEDTMDLQTYYHHKPNQVKIDDSPQRSKHRNSKLQDVL